MTRDRYGDVSVVVGDDFVAEVEIHRPPNNFFDVELIRSLSDAYDDLDADDRCRAIVLCAEGKHFCAGADFGGNRLGGSTGQLYEEAVRLFSNAKPWVAAVHGAAIGGGLGLACAADFRVGCPESRWSANFARLGFHHGFGLTVTLPAIVGNQHTLDLMYTGRRIGGEEAAAIGLCDRLVDLSEVRPEAHRLAASIAESGPLAIVSIRATMRGYLPDAIRKATDRESEEQNRLQGTEDFNEGIRATADRRTPEFKGR